MPDLSIIVVNRDTRELLASCLATAYDAASAAGIDAEFIVVDNGSSDGSIELIARDHPAVLLLCNRTNRGFAVANNQALAKATAPFALLLNSDAFITAIALRESLAVLRRQDHIGIVGVRIINHDGTLQAAHGTFPSLRDDIAVSLGLDRLADRPAIEAECCGAIDWVHGACLFVRLAAVTEIGGLDERFFMYSEEVDWCRRFRRGGWLVWYLGTTPVVHLGGASHHSDLARRVALYRGRLGLRRRWSGAGASTILWCCMLAGLTGRACGRLILQTLSNRRIGRQTARGDWALAQAVARMDPHARWAVIRQA